jgi:FtsP/CotA-like multicopper oxidase with cupredoxin domain
MREVARDGVRLAASVTVPNVLLHIANRADVAVQCNNVGAFSLTSGNSGNLNQLVGNVHTGTLASVIVAATGGGTIRGTFPTLSTPLLPSYLNDLRFAGVNARHNVNMMLGRRPNINGVSFAGPTDYQYTMALGSVQEWTLSGGTHPYHQHVGKTTRFMFHSVFRFFRFGFYICSYVR